MNNKKFDFVSIQYTDICNLGCPFCNLQSTTKGSTLDTATFDALIRYFSEVGTKVLLLTGGEVLQPNSQLISRLEPTDMQGIGEIVLQTNGVYLTREKFERLNCLPRLEVIEVSYHDQVSVQLREKIDHNIEDALNFGLPVEINYVVGKHNQKHVMQLFKQHSQLGARKFHFIRQGPEGYGKSEQNQIFPYSDWFGFLNNLRGEQKNSPAEIWVEPSMIDLKTFRKLRLQNFGACLDQKKIIITATGHIKRCFFLGPEQEEIISPSNLCRLIEGSKPFQGNSTDENCERCNIYSSCKGGCALYDSVGHDDAFKSKNIIPTCPILQVPISSLDNLLGRRIIAPDPIERYIQIPV